MRNSFCSPAGRPVPFLLPEEEMLTECAAGVSQSDMALIDRFAGLSRAERSAVLRDVRHLLAECFPPQAAE